VVDPAVTQLIDLAASHLRRATPVLVLLGGLPGSGKTTLSEEFARTAGVVHLSSDEIRRGSASHGGVADDADEWEDGAHTPAATEEVYRDLMTRAATALSEGFSVVLDASWRDAAQRDRAHDLARLHFAIPVDIRCEVADNAAFRRLARTRSGYSQAGAQTRERMASAFAPWPRATVLATDGDVETVLPGLRRAVESAVDDHVQRSGSTLRA
jgi:predicted kinase